MTDSAVVALIGGVFGGGAVVELVRRLVPSRQERRNLQAAVNASQAQFVDQVVKRVDSLDNEVRSLRREADKWREQYFQERDTNSRLSGEVTLLRTEVEQGKERIRELEQEVTRLEALVEDLSRRSA